MSDTPPTVSSSAQAITVAAGAAVPDTVTLLVNGASITGWNDVRITRRCEGLPNDFEIGLTATNPSDGSQLRAYAGDSCVVKIGKDVVITGTIDQDINAGDANSHKLTINGRGKCRNLVDCAAKYPGGMISGQNALQVISKLAEAYDISVSLAPGLDIPRPIPQFNLMIGETVQQIIDQVATYSGYLYYEDVTGDLILSQIGTVQAASGFIYGQNVQAWSVQNAMDQRFSEYICATVSVAPLTELELSGDLFFTAYDPNVKETRTMYLIAESVSGSRDLCEDRALWEAARRAGRGTMVRVTADSWRDAGGDLWAPNTRAPVTLPGLRLPAGTQLVISEVTFIYNEEQGKVVDVTLMPIEAFALQPIQIQPDFLATGENQPTAQPGNALGATGLMEI